MNYTHIFIPAIAFCSIYGCKVFVDYSLNLSKLSGSDEGVLSSCINGFKFLYSSASSYTLTKIYQKVMSHPSKNTYGIPFYHNGSWYKLPIILKRGPKPSIGFIKDENGEDVTEDMIQFMGPNLDFYNMKPSVRDFGYKKLIIEIDGNIKEFNGELDVQNLD